MSQVESSDGGGKGKAFFDRADEVALTGNWDFAIELYLGGIAREPGNIERGHQPLREVSLKRKALGGKGPGMMEKVKRRQGKDAIENLVNGEYLLAKEPGSTAFMEQFLKAAGVLELQEVAKWICDILMESQRQGAKPNKRVLLVLMDAQTKLERYASAIEACDMARELTPNDQMLEERLQDLTAKYTIQEGKYDGEGDFTRSVKDLDEQKRLAQRDALVKDKEYLEQQIQTTRDQYEQRPTDPGKINAYVDALLATEEQEKEDRGIEVLTKAHQETGAYRFKMRIGDVRIRQMSRRRRELLTKGDKDGDAQLAREQLEFELKEFAERVANYPTDLGLKYELGRRELATEKYDDAIVSFQHAQRDPRRRILAMTYLGTAFAKKGLLREAAETFERTLESELTEERTKELRYNLGTVLEQMGHLERAQEELSKVAQIDYAYEDVSRRLDAVRKKIEQQSHPET